MTMTDLRPPDEPDFDELPPCPRCGGEVDPEEGDLLLLYSNTDDEIKATGEFGTLDQAYCAACTRYFEEGHKAHDQAVEMMRRELDAHVGLREGRPTRLQPDQQQRALALLEGIAWDDLRKLLYTAEEMLRIVISVTGRQRQQWETHYQPQVEAHGHGELDLPPDWIESMPDEVKFAYVAHLVDAAVLCYGAIACGSSGKIVFAPDSVEDSPAALVRGLADIVSMPMTDEPAEG
jgi:hypothetical protein